LWCQTLVPGFRFYTVPIYVSNYRLLAQASGQQVIPLLIASSWGSDGHSARSWRNSCVPGLPGSLLRDAPAWPSEMLPCVLDRGVPTNFRPNESVERRKTLA